MSNKSTYIKATFDDTCTGWTKNRELNRIYLIYVQRYFNDLLRARGYVFLRDIYEYLGIPITKECVIYGWVYRDSDSFIDFGLTNIDQDTDNPNFKLGFNVDGDIFSQL